jgi:hypothetical protein
VTRGNTTTIRTKGRVPGQCDKPTEREWCDKRRHRAEPPRETRGWGQGARQSDNQPNEGAQRKVEEGCAYFFVLL